MGMISWLTGDTKDSIVNRHHPDGAVTVYLLQPNGKPSIAESNYNGYGLFGGVDVFTWIAEYNASDFGISLIGASPDDMRDIGCDLLFEREAELMYPLKLSFDANAKYECIEPSRLCPYQGMPPAQV
jgi:hypothetical protein